jgi:hypothetical protein
MTELDSGPLTNLIGSWKGEKGVDVLEPDGEWSPMGKKTVPLLKRLFLLSLMNL